MWDVLLHLFAVIGVISLFGWGFAWLDRWSYPSDEDLEIRIKEFFLDPDTEALPGNPEKANHFGDGVYRPGERLNQVHPNRTICMTNWNDRLQEGERRGVYNPWYGD